MAIEIRSSAFESGEPIPRKYTGDGQDLSPPITWSELPPGTMELALICDDPDAPSAEPWVHWVIFNIAAELSELPQGVGRQLRPDEVAGAVQGQNSWPSDNIGYRGPAPPPGSGRHRYVFKLYALDSLLELESGATKGSLLKAMSGHVLAEAQRIATYER
jgi:Raf kinase inhibitor-like YbhB/YbcL family protein